MNQKSRVLIVIRSLLVTYVLTGILLLLLAFFLYKLKLKEQQISIGVTGIYVLTCMLGGIVIGKGMGQRRFLWGMLLGLAYFAILLVVSLLMNQGLNQDIKNAVTVLIICVASGTAGGMLS